jgi:hypothetical protein
MTQLATLSLKNQAGTEVAFAVNGVNYTNNVASWAAAGASYDAKSVTSFSLTAPSAKSTRARVRLKLSIPIMDAVNPLLKVDESLVNIEFVLPKRSILLDRQNLRAYAADFLTDAIVVAAIENFEGVY